MIYLMLSPSIVKQKLHKGIDYDMVEHYNIKRMR